MTVRLAAIPRVFHLPRVNWDLVTDWIEQNIPISDRPQAWAKLAHDWLETVDLALGETHRVIRSDRIILFVPSDFEQAVALFDLAESGLKEMSELLGPLSCQSRMGPLVIMVFEDDDTYCRYVSPYDPDLESVRSSGVCFKHDYVHIALRPAAFDDLQRALLHEVAHACLSDRNLPLWIEEGLTQLAEEAATAPWARFALTSEEARKIRDFWQTRPLNEFWWGRGFSIPDEGQRHCYRLALILIRQLVSDHQGKLAEFLSQASALDAGETAAREILGTSLTTIAAQFLGPGDWKPVPPDAPAFVARGTYCDEQGQFEQGLRDFDQAIALDGKSFEAFSQRGRTLFQMGQITKSISDLEQAIELNPKDFHASNLLAWILATCPDEEVRDGERAIQLANLACERTGFSVWNCLGTLAAAHAEMGDFELARNFAEESLSLAPDAQVSACEARLQSYLAETPWRETHPLSAD